MSTATEVIPAFGYGESVTITLRLSDRPRIGRLVSALSYGPGYIRGVLSSLVDYSLFVTRGEVENADRYLRRAEQIARIQVGLENYRHAAGDCNWNFVLPGRTEVAWCGDPRCKQL